nr:unnamed protein product [Callosobruchus analis]
MARVCLDRLQCKYCTLKFGSCKSTRQHERAKHAEEYAQEVESLRDPMPEPEIFAIMAGIEDHGPPGRVNIRIAEATGVSIDQVRYRKKKPEFQKYLELAKRQLKAPGALATPTPSALRDLANLRCVKGEGFDINIKSLLRKRGSFACQCVTTASGGDCKSEADEGELLSAGP